MSLARYNWTHRKWCRPSDPINIIFEGISLNDVEQFLSGQGWQQTSFPLAESQVIPYPDPLNKQEQNGQLIKPIKLRILRRFHIRLWKVEDRVIAGVHMDALRAFGHTPADFESVEKYFSDRCKQNSAWEVLEDAFDLDNRISGREEPYNNGKATVIRRKRP